jgi:uncharacterized protein YdeI (BOF family)
MGGEYMAVTRGSGGSVGIWVLVVLAITAFFVVIQFVFEPEVPALPESAAADPPPLAVGEPDATVSEIFRNQSEFIGQTVTVRGHVTQIVTSNLFLLGDEATPDEIIVSIADLEARRGGVVREGETMQITGPVAEFDTSIFVRENVGEAELPRLGVMPMVLANEVVPLTGPGAESLPVREPISREQVTPTTGESPAP